MGRNENYEKLYDMLSGYAEEIHKKNQKRIRMGIRCLVLIPLVFLVLLFLTQSSKNVFLILWIVSLFLLAGYLILVEYLDDKLQEKLSEITHQEQMESEALIGGGIAQVEERLRTVIQNAEAERNAEPEADEPESPAAEADGQTAKAEQAPDTEELEELFGREDD